MKVAVESSTIVDPVTMNQRQGESMRSSFLRSGMCVHHPREKYISTVHLDQLKRIGFVVAWHPFIVGRQLYQHLVPLRCVVFADEASLKL